MVNHGKSTTFLTLRCCFLPFLATELPSSLPNPGYNIQAPSQQPAEISQGSYANPQSPSHANPQAPSHMNPQAPSRKHDGTWDCIRHTTRYVCF